MFDRFSSLGTEVGGGLQINGGAAVLARLGFLNDVKASARPMTRVVSRTAAGRKLLDLDVDAAVRGNPNAAAWLVVKDDTLLSPSSSPGDVMSFTIMRDKLMQILFNKLPAGTVQFGKTLARLEHRPSSDASGPMVCVFGDGSESAGFDLVVGCDGCNSKVREWVTRGEAESTYSGLRVQRGRRGGEPTGRCGGANATIL